MHLCVCVLVFVFLWGCAFSQAVELMLRVFVFLCFPHRLGQRSDPARPRTAPSAMHGDGRVGWDRATF